MMELTAAVTFGLLVLLALGDLRRRRLPNRYVALYAVVFLPWAWGTGLDLGGFVWHLVTAGLAFLGLFLLFVVGAMAGGDVKLGAAVGLWAGPEWAFPVVAIVAWSGGVVAVLGWFADRAGMCWQALTGASVGCILQALSARRGVPYGVALALGGAYVLWRQAQQAGVL